MDNKVISIIIPVFNEEENLPILIRDINILSKKTQYRLDIIFIDDCSADNSADIILKSGIGRLIRHKKNLGYGNTLYTGFKHARGDFIAICPADNQFNPQHFIYLFRFIDRDSIIITYRKHRKDRAIRWLLSITYNLIVSCILGFYVRDINWVKVFPRYIVRDIKRRGPTMDFFIIHRARGYGLNIIRGFVPHFPRQFGYEKGLDIKRFIKDLKNIIFSI